jgi:hypothetical protein
MGPGDKQQRRCLRSTFRKYPVHKDHWFAFRFAKAERITNACFITAKMFEGANLKDLLDVIEPLLTITDKFQQAAAAEILTGLLRGM